MPTSRRMGSSSLLFRTDWFKHMHGNTTEKTARASFHIFGKKASFANSMIYVFPRGARQPLVPATDLEDDNQALHQSCKPMVSTDSMSRAIFPRKVHPQNLEKRRQAAKGQTELLQTPEPKGWATHGSSLDLGKEKETPNARQTEASCKRARGRQDLLIFLHTAIQYSSDSKLFLLPPQPPYIKRMHFLLLGSKYQRGITARQGPVIASWEQTAVWRRGRT